MSPDIKLLLSGLAILLTFVAFVPYIRAILAGETKPHVFSWVIWGTTTMIVFLAQLDAEGGLGAWPTGVSGAVTFFIAFLAFLKRADISIKPVDWCFFAAAMASLPLWYWTSDPLWAVAILTVVDLLGFLPTVRKAYDAPHQENLSFFVIYAFRTVFAIGALEQYSVTTVLFPLAVGLGCIALVVLVRYRRSLYPK